MGSNSPRLGLFLDTSSVFVLGSTPSMPNKVMIEATVGRNTDLLPLTNQRATRIRLTIF